MGVDKMRPKYPKLEELVEVFKQKAPDCEPFTARKHGLATALIQGNSFEALVYYKTVVAFYDKTRKELTLATDNNRTTTTKSRINDFISRWGLIISQREGQWILTQHSSGQTIGFREGIALRVSKPLISPKTSGELKCAQSILASAEYHSYLHGTAALWHSKILFLLEIFESFSQLAQPDKKLSDQTEKETKNDSSQSRSHSRR